MGQLGRECKPRSEWEDLIVEHPDLNDLEPGKVYPQDVVDKLKLSKDQRDKVFKSLAAMGLGEDWRGEYGTSVWRAVASTLPLRGLSSLANSEAVESAYQ